MPSSTPDARTSRLSRAGSAKSFGMSRQPAANNRIEAKPVRNAPMASGGAGAAHLAHGAPVETHKMARTRRSTGANSKRLAKGSDAISATFAAAQLGRTDGRTNASELLESVPRLPKLRKLRLTP